VAQRHGGELHHVANGLGQRVHTCMFNNTTSGSVQ
jgi:hypothetical protein